MLASLRRIKECARRRTFKADERGLAGVEFALVAPLLMVIFFGAVEFTRVIAVDRKISQIAASTGDLVARADRTIDLSEVLDIMKISGYLLDPTPADVLRVTVLNVTSSPTNATDTKVAWRCEYVGASQQTTCTCPNTVYKLPSDQLIATNDSVIVATAQYAYKPLGLGSIFTEKTIDLVNTRYLKPRTQSAKLRFSSSTVC